MDSKYDPEPSKTKINVTAPDVIVVGAGLFGLTMAERLCNDLHRNVLLIDSRDHLGGNCYSSFDEMTGIECHQYGAHLFHTSDQTVWDYANRFTSFTSYIHKVYTIHHGEVFPLPINLGTINQFFRQAYTPDEARKIIAKQTQAAPIHPKNLIEQGIALIGQPLFDAFIKNYTAKQWQIPAEELPSNIIRRLPVRFNYDNRYFNSLYEGLPANGYAAWFNNIVKSCGPRLEVRLHTDFFTNYQAQELYKQGVFTVFTGPIDRFYNYKFGALTWRSLRFEKEVLDIADFQGCPVMNYADLDKPFTRIHEFKHFHPERSVDDAYKDTGYFDSNQKTVIVREFSESWTVDKEPYYPVGTQNDQSKLEQYQELAAQENHLIFGGRLGEYAYYDMDATIASALKAYRDVKRRLGRH